MAHPATRFTISQTVPFGKVDILRREIERRGRLLVAVDTESGHWWTCRRVGHWRSTGPFLRHPAMLVVVDACETIRRVRRDLRWGGKRESPANSRP